ncbi:MAG: hypothetical protein LBQ78_06250 [Tannerellaceae bacterium]|jgi:hypothetical protein|nr:hypothetical protein [Tannerellaceae bacterium]
MNKLLYMLVFLFVMLAFSMCSCQVCADALPLSGNMPNFWGSFWGAIVSAMVPIGIYAFDYNSRRNVRKRSRKSDAQLVYTSLDRIIRTIEKNYKALDELVTKSDELVGLESGFYSLIPLTRLLELDQFRVREAFHALKLDENLSNELFIQVEFALVQIEECKSRYQEYAHRELSFIKDTEISGKINDTEILEKIKVTTQKLATDIQVRVSRLCICLSTIKDIHKSVEEKVNPSSSKKPDE